MVSIQKAKKLLVSLYGSGQNAMLLGDVGVGKTEGAMQVGKEIAASLKKDFVEYDGTNGAEILAAPEKYFVFVGMTITHIEPTDLSGIPREHDGYMVYKPLEYAEILRKTGGILFIDEVPSAQRLDQVSAVMRVFGESGLGYLKLPPTVMIIGAGNQPSQSSVAQELPEPIRAGKVLLLPVDAPTLDEWAEYMDEKLKGDWDRRIYIYVKQYGTFVESAKSKADTENEPIRCPRVWTKIAEQSHKLKDKDELELFAKSYIGKETVQLMTFLNTKVPDLAELEKTPEMFKTLDLSAKYFVVLELSKQSPAKYPKTMRVIAESDREMLEMYIVLLPKERRARSINEIREKLPDVLQAITKSAVRAVKLMNA
jgi:hypothetical protein